MGVDNIKFSKPERAKWLVVHRAADKHVVYRPDGAIHGIYETAKAAQATRQHKQAQDDERLGKKERPCLCCQRAFLSDGIHNRLCDTCRRQGGELVPYGIAQNSRGARKAGR